MHGRPITVYGRGDAIRDFTYIADVVDGVVAALSLNATGAEVVMCVCVCVCICRWSISATTGPCG